MSLQQWMQRRSIPANWGYALGVGGLLGAHLIYSDDVMRAGGKNFLPVSLQFWFAIAAMVCGTVLGVWAAWSRPGDVDFSAAQYPRWWRLVYMFVLLPVVVFPGFYEKSDPRRQLVRMFGSIVFVAFFCLLQRIQNQKLRQLGASGPPA